MFPVSQSASLSCTVLYFSRYLSKSYCSFFTGANDYDLDHFSFSPDLTIIALIPVQPTLRQVLKLVLFIIAIILTMIMIMIIMFAVIVVIIILLLNDYYYYYCYFLIIITIIICIIISINNNNNIININITIFRLYVLIKENSSPGIDTMTCVVFELNLLLFYSMTCVVMFELNLSLF